LSQQERTRVGRLLQRLRDDQTQEQIADKLGCAIGTVQAIEYNKHKVDRDTIEQYAALFNTTTQQLLHPESPAIAASDPLVADLNHEHLKIARRYMRAVDAVREAVKLLLTDNDVSAEEVAGIVVGLKQASEASPEDGLAWIHIVMHRADLVQDLAHRLDTDPGFEAKLLELLNLPKGQK
jgi:transcriptional regulator with XRE-family HTH domain